MQRPQSELRATASASSAPSMSQRPHASTTNQQFYQCPICPASFMTPLHGPEQRQTPAPSTTTVRGLEGNSVDPSYQPLGVLGIHEGRSNNALQMIEVASSNQAAARRAIAPHHTAPSAPNPHGVLTTPIYSGGSPSAAPPLVPAGAQMQHRKKSQGIATGNGSHSTGPYSEINDIEQLLGPLRKEAEELRLELKGLREQLAFKEDKCRRVLEQLCKARESLYRVQMGNRGAHKDPQAEDTGRREAELNFQISLQGQVQHLEMSLTAKDHVMALYKQQLGGRIAFLETTNKHQQETITTLQHQSLGLRKRLMISETLSVPISEVLKDC